jgi:hypothetical protein
MNDQRLQRDHLIREGFVERARELKLEFDDRFSEWGPYDYVMFNDGNGG